MMTTFNYNHNNINIIYNLNIIQELTEEMMMTIRIVLLIDAMAIRCI
jgi:hypothetical protein